MIVILTCPSAFFLSSAVRHGIAKTIDRALSDPKVTAVVICGENGRFCGG